MEATNQAVATMPSQNSVTPTSVAPQAVSQPVSSPPQAYQASAPMPQLDLAQHPGYQASAPAPQASAAQAGNPWQEAFQALSASLNTSSPYQAQVQPSAYQATPTPQANTQAAWASQAPSYQAQTQYSAAPTYSPQALTQAYLQQQVAEPQVQQSAQVRDAYLSQVSDESLEVLEHFGAEAPQLLNTYACAVEDALIEQVQRGQSMSLMLEAAGEERAAMNLMLTDPDVLADYVNDFYGPEGPYPTPTEAEAAEIQNILAREQFEQEIMQQEQQNGVPRNFQRPEMAMPTPGRQANAANDFWGGFGQLMDNNPEEAWKYLSQAPGAAFQQKMLVQDA